MALSQLAAAWPASRTVSIELDEIGAYSAYSYSEGGQLMANVSVLPFGGAHSLGVAYCAGINLISNMYTAGRMEAFTRNLLFPTVTEVTNGLAATERLWLTTQSTLAADTSLPEARRRIHSGKATRSRNKVSAMPASWQQRLVSSIKLASLPLTSLASTTPLMRLLTRRTVLRKATTALARPWRTPFKPESGVLTVLQRSSGTPAEWTRLGKQVSGRLTCTPLLGSAETKEKLTGKFVAEPIRLVVVSKETAKMITECTIKTKLHVAACSGANASDDTGTICVHGGLAGLALEQLNNPVTSIERIPHKIADDAAVAEWMNAFIEAAAADDTKVTCSHQRWTKEGGGAFDVELADDSGDAAVIWQVEEWVLDANEVTKQAVNPSDTIMHRTSVAHANPTPVKLKKAIVRTGGAGPKITNWCRTNRPGLPWFSTAPADATASSAEPSSTTIVQGGQHGFGRRSDVHYAGRPCVWSCEDAD